MNFSTRRLRKLVAALVGCNLLLLGPCYVDQAPVTKPGIEQMKYGDSANWDGTMPKALARTCWDGQCFH